MPAPKNARDVFVTELKEILSAERQMSRALPKVIKRVTSEPLKAKLNERLEQGARIVEELDSIFDEMQVTKARPKNVAIEGLIEDINQHMEEIKDPLLLDPVILAAVQKIEHYCIAAWGTAASLGRRLNEQRTVQLMESVLDEGKRFDEEMTEVAETEVNPGMLEAEAQEA